MTKLNQSPFDALVSFLLPFVQLQRDRRPLLSGAVRNMDWDGDPVIFARRLVRLLQDQGRVETLRDVLQPLVSDINLREIEACIAELSRLPPPSLVPSLTMPEVYLCYSKQDNMSAQALRRSLEDSRINVWSKEDRIQPGSHISIDKELAIRRANAVIVLITDAANRSMRVRNEVLFAQDTKRAIIPLLMEASVRPMIDIYGLESVDMYSDWDRGLSMLIEHAHEHASVAQDGGGVATTRNQPQPSPADDFNEQQSDYEGDPFFFGGAVPPTAFAGRQSALAMIRQRVGGNPYSLQSLSIVANRHMGKSSLLKYVWKNYQRVFPSGQDFAMVYVDASDARAHTVSGVMRILRRAVKRQLNRDLWDERHDGKLPLLAEAFEEFEQDEIRLVLLLDEWESVMAFPELQSLLMQLRSSGSLGQIGMITATAHLLDDLEAQGGMVSGFPNIFATFYLGNMPDLEWRELLSEGFERSGRSPNSDMVDLVGELAGGHPYLTQLAGSLIWQARDAGWNEAQIRGQFSLHADPIFSSIWQRLDEEQVRVARWALDLEADPNVPQNILTDLRKRGVLTGSNELFCKPFTDYVAQELGMS